MSRRTSIVSLLLGAALLVGAPALWWASQPDETVGDFEVEGLPQALPDDRDGSIDDLAPPPAPSRSTADVEAPAGEVEEDPEVTPAGEPLRLTATPLSGAANDIGRPSRIQVPAIGVDAPVDPVGQEPDGAMEIPHDIRRIGWYSPGGVRPGRNGTAVLSGHVDSRTQGRGAFYDLRRLDVDDEVIITDDDGATTTWRVVGRTSYGKAEIPLEDIFTRSGEPRLALITCGGEFDPSTRSYQENVVVYAVPVGAAATS